MDGAKQSPGGSATSGSTLATLAAMLARPPCWPEHMSADHTPDFIAFESAELFLQNGLRSFEDWWARETELFEAPNARRGGWSSVARLELPRPDHAPAVVFLKRQENHNQRNWRHPLRGVPTLQLEFDNIQRCRAHGLGTLRPLYFARRRVAGKDRAVLVTEELTGFQSLADFTVGRGAPRPPFARRLAVIQAVAGLLCAMQRAGLRHNNFYPKHIFLRPDGARFETRLIDLEKAVWHRSATACGVKDLRTLHRRAKGWSRADRLRFLLAYLEVKKITPEARRLWQQLARN